MVWRKKTVLLVPYLGQYCIWQHPGYFNCDVTVYQTSGNKLRVIFGVHFGNSISNAAIIYWGAMYLLIILPDVGQQHLGYSKGDVTLQQQQLQWQLQ